MALIKLGAFITQISGKVGGQSFATGRGGSYIKNIGSYTTKKTALTSSKLTNFSFLAGQWRLLSQEKRDAWANSALDFPYTNRLGELKEYSGYVLFIKFNGSLVQVGQDPIFDAPRPQSFVPLVGWEVVYFGEEWFLQIPTSTANTLMSFKVSRPVQPSVGPNGLNFSQIIGGIVPNDGVNLEIIPFIVQRFGYAPTGYRFYYQLDLISIASGQRIANVITGFFDFSE